MDSVVAEVEVERYAVVYRIVKGLKCLKGQRLGKVSLCAVVVGAFGL